MARTPSARKARKTFSLSRDAVSYLEAVRKQTHRESISSVLEDIIRQQRQAKELERIGASFTDYYDSLTDEEVAEDRAWGEFALTQSPPED
jgi:hypothetical protein